jgi:hypothetical protein
MRPGIYTLTKVVALMTQMLDRKPAEEEAIDYAA